MSPNVTTERYNKRKRNIVEEEKAGQKNKDYILIRNHKHIYLCNVISMIQV